MIEPEPQDRIWFYHVSNGWNGYLLQDEEGREFIRVMLVGHEHIEPFSKRNWSPKRELRPLTPGHVAEIAFAADVVLANHLGERGPRQKTTWLATTQEEKIPWISGDGPGPAASPKRQELFLLLRIHFKDDVI